jgi:hypothetical protein
MPHLSIDTPTSLLHETSGVGSDYRLTSTLSNTALRDRERAGITGLRLIEQPIGLPSFWAVESYLNGDLLGRRSGWLVLPASLIGGVVPIVRKSLGDRFGETLQGGERWRTPGGFPTGATAKAGVGDEEAADSPPHRPAAGTAPRRGVRGQPVCPLETVDRLVVGEEYPAGGQVEGRIARAQIAEVDHAAEVAILGENIGWVQVPVQPERRP